MLIIDTYSPADGDTNASASNISAVFNRNITAGTGKKIEIWQDKNTTDVQQVLYDVTSVSVPINGTTLSVTPIQQGHLAYGKPYYIKIEADAYTNSNTDNYLGITDDTTWNFTTSATGGPCGCMEVDNCDLPPNLQ
jgi:hypothetical protein